MSSGYAEWKGGAGCQHLLGYEHQSFTSRAQVCKDENSSEKSHSQHRYGTQGCSGLVQKFIINFDIDHLK